MTDECKSFYPLSADDFREKLQAVAEAINGRMTTLQYVTDRTEFNNYANMTSALYDVLNSARENGFDSDATKEKLAVFEFAMKNNGNTPEELYNEGLQIQFDNFIKNGLIEQDGYLLGNLENIAYQFNTGIERATNKKCK